MSANPFKEFVAVPRHGGKKEWLAREGATGLLCRINENADGRCRLWILTEPCYQNRWADEQIHEQGREFATLAKARDFAFYWWNDWTAEWPSLSDQHDPDPEPREAEDADGKELLA